ncbi:hypothetical protein JCM11641_003957 [Rhodosporidiobolus odoratus]
MSYSQPRPYHPHQLHSPTSFDSLQPPPHSANSSGQTSPTSSSDGLDTAFATLQGQGKRGQQGAGAQGRGRGLPPPPPQHPEREKHSVVQIGGTGLKALKEDPRLMRKRVTLMVLCGSVIAAIVVLAVLGCKGIL